MPWIDWKDLSEELQTLWAERMGPFYADKLPNYKFYVTKTGKLPQRGNWFRWTTTYGAYMKQKQEEKIKARVRDYYNVRTKGDLRDYKTATFHFAPEKKD